MAAKTPRAIWSIIFPVAVALGFVMFGHEVLLLVIIVVAAAGDFVVVGGEATCVHELMKEPTIECQMQTVHKMTMDPRIYLSC